MADKNTQADPRQISLDLLLLVTQNGMYYNTVLGGVMEKYAYLPENRKSFIRHLTDGCIRYQIYLDYCIDQFSKTKTNKMKPVIRTILRMGAYQLLFMSDSVPESAAVNEAVRLAKKRGFTGLSGFVNGVLRAIARGRDNISLPDKDTQWPLYLSVVYSIPEWLAETIIRSLDKAGVNEPDREKVFGAILEKRPLIMRLSQRISDEEKQKVLDSAMDEGIKVRASEKLAYAYYLENAAGISRLYGYEEGLFYIQDIGSMLVVEYADVKAGDLVVDVCAAPGGKALHAADRLSMLEKETGKKGRVIARDLTPEKTGRIEENLARFGFTNVTVEVHDAMIPDESLEGRADVVIADLPCSGIGVIGRKPDIKYRLTPEQITALRDRQREILKVVSRYVKSGGTLMYSTCTMTSEENEDNRDWILENLPFTLEDEHRLTPGADDSDGFYILKLKRNESN